MTCDTARSQIQAQIDGALDPAAARDLERHLDQCGACRALAADLSAIADAASGLAPIPPPEHVWLQLAGRWRREQPESAALVPFTAAPKRRSYTGWHALATAAVLSAAAGGAWIAWRATGSATTAPQDAVAGVLLERPQAAGSGNATSEALVESAQRDIEAAEQLYVRAIAGLEQAAASQKALLTPEVAAMVDRNLEVIDQAIVESRAAVRAEPTDVVARESLFEALRKKVTMLQNTISLVTEISKGNQAGASRLTGT